MGMEKFEPEMSPAIKHIIFLLFVFLCLSLQSVRADNQTTGDVTGDFKVDINDLQVFLDQWLDEGGCSGLGCADFDGQDGINFNDFAVLAKNWNKKFLFISEVMASNDSNYQDPQEAGEYPDWIEIYNAGDITINMGGLYLTDNADIPNKFRIPDGVTIGANSRLIFIADNETYQGPLHTNFKIKAEGDDIYLFSYDEETIIDSVIFGQQYSDISYGRYPDNSDVVRFMGYPTPGTGNNPGYLGLVEDTRFSVERGFYDAPFQVRLACDTSDAEIRYTLDGSDPCNPAGSAIYNNNSPIQITTTTIVRAIANKAGYKSSDVDTQSYIFLKDVINQSNASAIAKGFSASWAPLTSSPDYGMDSRVVYDMNYYPTIKDDLKTIPSIFVGISKSDFFGYTDGIYSNASNRELEKPASIEYFDPQTGKTFQINAGLTSHGGVGRTYRKHALRMIFKSDYGPANLEFPLYKDTDVEKFNSLVLKSTWNYSWFGDSQCCSALGYAASQYNRDTFSRDTARDLGIITPYGRHVHLYIDGLYWGLYKLVERPDEAFAEEHLGGTKVIMTL